MLTSVVNDDQMTAVGTYSTVHLVYFLAHLLPFSHEGMGADVNSSTVPYAQGQTDTDVTSITLCGGYPPP